MSYFQQVGAAAYRPTEHVGGAWTIAEQHIAPTLGLLTHLVEADRGHDALVLSRLSFDILGPVPMDTIETGVAVLRPGRTIELVEATASFGGRAVVRLRAWLVQPGDTADLAGTALAAMPAPEELETWDASTVWPGGFIASVQVRRHLVEPGRGRFWVRTDVPLLDRPVSRLAAALGLFDVANGMVVRVSPDDVAFPNVDLTAHLFRDPGAGWLGFDTTVSFGPDGRGLTSTIVHDEQGPFGTIAQTLTVRPRS